MRKRIKKTGEIVDVIAYSSGTERCKLDSVKYIDEGGNEVSSNLNYYYDFEDIETDTSDYWTKFRHQASLAALSGININRDFWGEDVNLAIKIADNLIEKLKKKN